MTPADLVTAWRERAATLRPYSDAAATAFETAAMELAESLGTLSTDEITLGEAATITGYTSDHLGRLIRNGTLENVGRKHAPRVRRRDVVGLRSTRGTRPRILTAEPTGPYDPRADARSLARRRNDGGRDAA